MQRLTQEQAVVIGAFTGVLCGSFSDLHEYVEKIMERPVWTHEMGTEAVCAEIKERSREDFLALCAVVAT